MKWAEEAFRVGKRKHFVGFAGLITGKRFLFYEKRTEQMLHQVRTFSLGLLQIDPDNADKQSRLTPEVILAFGVRSLKWLYGVDWNCRQNAA